MNMSKSMRWLCLLLALVPSAALAAIFDVTDFDADCNGDTDSEKQVQAAIDAAEEGKGDIIYFPPGCTFLIDGDGEQGPKEDNGMLEGNKGGLIYLGYGATLKKGGESTKPTLHIIPDQGAPLRDVGVYGLTFDGSFVGGQQSVGLKLNTVHNAIVKDVTTRNHMHNGLGVQNCSNVILTKILAENNHVFGVVPQDSEYVHASKITVRNNTACHGSGFEFKRCFNSTLDGLTVENLRPVENVRDRFCRGSHGLNIRSADRSNVKNIVASNIRIRDVGKAGVFIHIDATKTETTSVCNSTMKNIVASNVVAEKTDFAVVQATGCKDSSGIVNIESLTLQRINGRNSNGGIKTVLVDGFLIDGNFTRLEGAAAQFGSAKNGIARIAAIDAALLPNQHDHIFFNNPGGGPFSENVALEVNLKRTDANSGLTAIEIPDGHMDIWVSGIVSNFTDDEALLEIESTSTRGSLLVRDKDAGQARWITIGSA